MPYQKDRRILIINGCAFPAEFPPFVSHEYAETDDWTEELYMFARECTEEIVKQKGSVIIAGGPNGGDVEIAKWAAPHVAREYGVDGGSLFARWLKHAGPLEAQILLNPALLEAAVAVLKERGAST